MASSQLVPWKWRTAAVAGVLTLVAQLVSPAWSTYLANADGNYVTADNTYCNICNPFQYSTSIMIDSSQRAAHLKDTTDLYAALPERNSACRFVREARRLA
jgi:hypothetical protein